MTREWSARPRRIGRFLRAFLPIVAPAVVLLLATMVVVYGFLVPLFERTYVQQKRDLCRRLVETVISDLELRERAVTAGETSRDEAQRGAIARVRGLRFGEDDRDYFWIVGPDGRFLMHPYRPDLMGRDPRRVRGPDGAPLRELIATMEQAVGPGGDGLLTYRWHWQDDLSVLVEKISYVERFEPWGWIVGTGVYPADMARDMASLRRRLTVAGVVLGLLASGLAFLLSMRVMRSQAREAAAHDRLAASEEHLRITLQSIGDAVIATDDQGRVAEMNAVAEALTGFSVAEAAGRPLTDVFRLVDAASREPVAGLLDRVRERGEVITLPADNLLVARDGQRRRIADSAAPIRARSGAIVGTVVVFRDVTEEYALQERLRQSQKMEVVGQLAGGVAHDFNNMLAAIMGSAELIDLDLPGDSPLRAHVATILRGARNAADLTQKLLTFSRKRRLAREPVDLHAVIEAAIGLLDRSLDRRIDIQTRLAAERSHVVGDASQLQNVFLNLALNARDAMPEGGTLTFATTACPPPGSGAQDTGAGPPADWLAATVSDTGVGMPPEMVERVLEPFFTTKPLGEGTGLGLATVYGAVEEHGGTVSIDSEPGRGTTVRILLPGARGADLAAEPPPVEEVRGSGRVLVVDDDELVRSMAGAQLRGLGYEVVAARSGAEAVTLLARDPDAFDAVLLDLIMPGLDGQATFARLRDLRADLPVVFSSGYDPDQAMDDLIAQGGVGFVAKPYRRSELARALAAAMDPTTRRPGSG